MTHSLRHTSIASPLGDLLAVRDDVGLTHLYLPSGRHPRVAPAGSVADAGAFDDVRDQLAQYFAGERTEFDLPLHATGTRFQHTVWDALVAIPHGETRSYGQLAAEIGSPGASRAVGLANGQNPVSIVVPCHRVIGANGSLTGYGGGLPAKKWLLAHEAQRSGLFADA
ncbi:methylated-DNA-[protein]-cysteine S-methyltransferase [Jatrophihabitans endophyticus]|uniref:Methylated-DNA--protein-cysteine methyltransferase n=1 Tax=Jatrophihabitans endophyticus TaxID=1206085 RepID=A0A1M5U596_9ACTN|nr:methylated-DNA--[protein]-cysteine S-methyltransferase [Jatrophihabitans endophyticus]SHH58255.1 methylated-DNA-[protein]-cysteine S-methyltransferase [Jatrophihabitans endophyticus]